MPIVKIPMKSNSTILIFIEYGSIYYTCCCFCVCAHHSFFFFLLMLPHNLNLPKITSPPLCNDVSSLLWWRVYWCEGGKTCHSHEIANNNSVSHSISSQWKISTPPQHLFLFKKCFIQIHITIETKRLLQLLFITLIITQSTLATALQHPENHPKHACEFCMITFSANVNK